MVKAVTGDLVAGVHGLELLRRQRGDVQIRFSRIPAPPVQPQKAGIQVEGAFEPVTAKYIYQPLILCYAVVIAERDCFHEYRHINPSFPVENLLRRY